MEKAHSEILRKNLVRIGKDLYVDDTFLNYMEAADSIITESMREEIEAQPTKSKSNSKFIYLLKKRGPTAFKTFIFALMETQQIHLAEYLHANFAAEYKRNNSEESRTYPVSGDRTSGSIQQQSLPYTRQRSIDEEDDEGIDMMNGVLMNIEVRKIDPDDQERSHYFYNLSSSVYKMNSNKRGRALIINNKMFPSYPVPERHGTDIDATNMDMLLSSLNYKVITKNDLTADELVTVLSNESMEKEHAEYDSFVCVILSHGGVNSIYGVDGKPVTIEDITSYFDNSGCPALAGKPKLFIIQACQGQEYDQGVMTERTDSAAAASGDSSMKEATKAMKNMSLNDREEEIFKGQKLPTKGDMLIAFPSYVGYRSWRNAEFGSWYIRSVVEVFMKYSCKMHVEQLLKKVRRKIANTQTINKSHYKQMTADYVSFTKDMYFFPGLQYPSTSTCSKDSHQPCDN